MEEDRMNWRRLLVSFLFSSSRTNQSSPRPPEAGLSNQPRATAAASSPETKSSPTPPQLAAAGTRSPSSQAACRRLEELPVVVSKRSPPLSSKTSGFFRLAHPARPRLGFLRGGLEVELLVRAGLREERPEAELGAEENWRLPARPQSMAVVASQGRLFGSYCKRQLAATLNSSAERAEDKIIEDSKSPLTRDAMQLDQWGSASGNKEQIADV